MEGKAVISRELYVSLTSSRGQSVSRYFASFQPGRSVSFSYSSAPPAQPYWLQWHNWNPRRVSCWGHWLGGIFHSLKWRSRARTQNFLQWNWKSLHLLVFLSSTFFPGLGDLRGFQKWCGLLPTAEMCFRVTGWPVMILGSIWWSSQDCTRAGAVVGRQAWQARVFAYVSQVGTGELLLFIISLSMLRWKNPPNSVRCPLECFWNRSKFI